MQVNIQRIMTSDFPNAPNSELGVRFHMKLNKKNYELHEDYNLDDLDFLIKELELYSKLLHEDIKKRFGS